MELISSRSNNVIRTFRLMVYFPRELQLTLYKVIGDIRRKLDEEFALRSIKFQICTHLQMKKFEYDDAGNAVTRYCDPYFVSYCKLYIPGNFDVDVHSQIGDILSRLDVFVEMGSGWVVSFILDYTLTIYNVSS